MKPKKQSFLAPKILNRGKAQGLSINTIIIAIIAVLVLIVLVVILGTNIRRFTGNTDSCANRGGKCTYSDLTGSYDDESGCPPPRYIISRGTECEDITKTKYDFDSTESDSGAPIETEETLVCCVPIFENEES
jgi:hypothetical protein